MAVGLFFFRKPIDNCVYRVYTVYSRYVQSAIYRKRGRLMEIYISNTGSLPIYAQITGQIKEKILNGELASGQALPSIRLLAKELRISVITTKRAYEELEAEGFVYTVPGKGVFVNAPNPELHREETLRRVEELLQQALDTARAGGVSVDEVRATLALLTEGE